MKLLYITRKYPPMVGGMEKVNHALIKELSKKTDLTALTWGGSQKFLPLVLPYFLLKSLILIPVKGITNVHLGDALLSPVGYVLKKIYGVKLSVTVHGLDVTSKFAPYQLVVPKTLAKLDKIICVSEATKNECIKRGIPKDKCDVIANGVYPEEFRLKATRDDLEKIIGQKLKNKKVIVTVGRLVPRKGVYWFIENVLPELNSNFIYLVIGDGPERERIENLIRTNELKNKVLLLGRIGDKELKIIYNTADLMVLPNRRIEGDMEGFGVVALEAGSSGLPVLASNIEGLRDAVREKVTGMLVEPQTENILRIIKKVITMNRSKITKFIKKKYSWQSIAGQYVNALIYE